MAEKSTFFNSVSGDRKYKAEDMAAHFAKLITNGVYPAGTQLQVTEDTGMNVTISAGSAWINGYAYHNDGDFTLTFDAADGVLNRIDRIVIRWGRLARSINLAIVKGTPASSPVAPAIVRNADYYDLGIATVSINAGITAITQAMITDTRLDSDVCGFVSSLIQPDTSDWFTQFNSAFTTALNNNQSTWDTWFATLEDILDENVAGNLLNMINNLAGEGRTNETVKGNADALLSHKEETATDAHTPKNVGISVQAAGDLLYGSGENTITRLAKGTAGQLLAINASATALEWKDVSLSDGAWVKITETVLEVNAAQVDFTDLSSYSKFRVFYGGIHDTTGASINLRFNDDVSGLIEEQKIFITASSVSTGGGASMQAALNLALSPSDKFYSFGEITIDNPADKNKRYVTRNVISSSTNQNMISGGVWKSNTKINKLSFLASVGNIAIGSYFELWGVED